MVMTINFMVAEIPYLSPYRWDCSWRRSISAYKCCEFLINIGCVLLNHNAAEVHARRNNLQTTYICIINSYHVSCTIECYYGAINCPFEVSFQEKEKCMAQLKGKKCELLNIKLTTILGMNQPWQFLCFYLPHYLVC